MAGPRQLVVLRGEEAVTRREARICLAHVDPDEVLWVGSGEGEEPRPQRRLGQGFDAVVVSLHDRLDLDRLGLCQGFVRGGGALVLRVPPDDALEESIQSQIAGIPSVRVKSRLAFAGLSGRQSELLARAPDLGIEHIIAGKANRFGTDLRVDIQVIDVSTKSISMAFSRRIPWIESLEHIDPLAADFKSAYEKILKALQENSES